MFKFDMGKLSPELFLILAIWLFTMSNNICAFVVRADIREFRDGQKALSQQIGKVLSAVETKNQ